MKIVVLDGYCLNPGDLTWDPLRELGEIEVHDRTPPAVIVPRAAGAAAVFTNKTPLSRETLTALPDLRFIGVLATGYNVVDTAAARERGITVTNIPAYGTQSVGQHAIALLLEFTNRVAAHAAASRAGAWSRNPDWSYSAAPLMELEGKTLGIVGFGRIGQQTGRIAHALGMKVTAHDSNMNQGPTDYPFAWISLKGLLEESDVVSLHCPLFPETKGLINAQTLRRMKRSAILINTSRGPLIEDQALADALNEGVIAGAALDVLSEEPPSFDNPLLTARNCIVTPHIAWATREARERLLGMAVENLRAWLRGTPVNSVN
jgi:glycerate dehydrogenase